jgi:hypothetical protein
MSGVTADQIACRTCGRPRGENIAEGTRCARCGERQALGLWVAGGVCAAGVALQNGATVASAAGASLAALAAMPIAFPLAVLIHELAHAATAALLGQSPVRVIVGEGRALLRIGRRPQLVIGSVIVGNGLTTVLDLRREGFRLRTCVMLLAAPAVSAMAAAAFWSASAGWPLPARAAALTCAVSNVVMALVTLLPTPTFGGRVWSDLASARYIARASGRDIDEIMVQGARDAMVASVEEGDVEQAIRLARAAVDLAPESPSAHSLLAFALHHSGRHAEAAGVARAILDRKMEPAERAYLERFLAVPGAPLLGGDPTDANQDSAEAHVN